MGNVVGKGRVRARWVLEAVVGVGGPLGRVYGFPATLLYISNGCKMALNVNYGWKIKISRLKNVHDSAMAPEKQSESGKEGTRLAKPSRDTALPRGPEPAGGARAAAPGQPDRERGRRLGPGQQQTPEAARGWGHCACFLTQIYTLEPGFSLWQQRNY